ncbi:Long-chain-fatty-acid--CoA ligase FadD15 [Acidipropionibacterium jensenii]|uniref:Long-chain-fatty-acid--CoA ligase FadD15 n=1 Tax=Acidipropionibacterium jensenii TaxID=1749 RepID=A0A3S4VJ96_9ACTN|nr:Long-chain-fatty-acid--CoA ligase FadD15 [Acidipropionibacterium jensenii]
MPVADISSRPGTDADPAAALLGSPVAGEDPAEVHLAHMFRDTVSRYAYRPASRVKVGEKWQIRTYADMGRRVEAISLALVEHGIARGDRVAIFSHNSPEWIEIDLAVMTVGAVPVPIYPTSTGEQVVHIIADAGVRIACVAGPAERDLVASIHDRTPSLKAVVVIDTRESDEDGRSGSEDAAGGGVAGTSSATEGGVAGTSSATEGGVAGTSPAADSQDAGPSVPGGAHDNQDAAGGDLRVVALADVLSPQRTPERTAELKTGVEERMSASSGDDVASLIYTSGTTGAPKGVMITHRAAMAQARTLDAFFDIRPSDHSLCFLPLSHALEWAWSMVLLTHGCLNTFVTNPKTIASMLVEVRPTLFVSVPKLYEQVMTVAHEKVSDSRVKTRLFNWSIDVGRRWWQASEDGRRPELGLRLRHKVADALVLKAVRAAVGGPKTVLAAGGAPLRQEVEEFFASVGLLVCQGYGLTEASPLVSFNSPGAHKFGTAGKPLVGSEIKEGAEGEILYRGPNIMKGYWNAPEATAQTIQDGWLHTGDVGHVDEDGYLVITDRLKDIIVTLNGKNISPQPIEGLLMADPLFEQAVILGDNRPCLTLLVKPSMPRVEELAEKLHLSLSGVDAMRSPELVEELRRRVADLTAKLPHQEQIRDLRVLWDDFTQDNGLLTPTLKVRRREVETRFTEVIDEMYSRLAKLRKADHVRHDHEEAEHEKAEHGHAGDGHGHAGHGHGHGDGHRGTGE